MYSTLQFSKSLRESGAPFEKIAYSHDGKHIMSIEPSSRRYWGNGKHAKAQHETGVFFGPDRKPIFLAHVGRYDSFLSIVLLKRPKDGKHLQLTTWEYTMKISSEKYLGDQRYSIACIDRNQKYIALCGASLLVLVVGKPPAIPCMPIGSTEAATPYINVPDSRFAVSEYQTLSTDDMRGFDLSKMTCIEFVTPNILAACSSTDCCLCVRLPPAPPPPTPGSRSSRRKIKDPDVSAEIKGPFPFRCVRFENASFLERPGVTVLSMKTWFTDAAVFFVIGYADGEIAVYASKSLAETAVALNKYDPTVHEESVAIITTPQFVCSFDAYSGDNGDPSLRLPSLSIQLSEPLSLLRKTFAFELFTMERRGIVCHWGVSTKVADVKCSLLGSYSMGVNRQLEFSNADATVNSLFPGSGTTSKAVMRKSDRPEILAVLPCWFDNPHRSIICSVGGQMCFLSIVQPQVVLMKSQALPAAPLLLIGACKGAEESKPSFRSTRLLTSAQSVEYQGPEILALERESSVVNSISALDGTRLFDFSVQCPEDFADIKDVMERVVPPKSSVTGKHCPIAYNSSVALPTRVQNTVLSCVTYSNMCSCTVVGYQSGAICAFLAKNVIDSETHGLREQYTYFRFKTKEIHGTSIRALRTIPRNDNAAEYLISADDSGVVALWGLAIGVVKSVPNCLWTTNAHVGSILDIQLIIIPCRSEESKKFEIEGQLAGSQLKFYDHKIIVTACTAGIVKTWKLVDPGVLNIVGSLRTGGKPQLTSFMTVGFLKDPDVPTSPSAVNPPKLVAPRKRPGSRGNRSDKSDKSDDGDGEDEEVERRFEADRLKPVLFDYEGGPVGKNSWAEPKAITAGVDFNIIAVCGRSTGLVDTWVLSNDPGRCSKDGCPVAVKQLHMSSVVAIRQIPDIIVNENGDNFPLAEDYSCNVVSTSKDGWQVIFEADFIGEVLIKNQISLGSSSFNGSMGVKDIILVPNSNNGERNRYIDCLVVREEGISKYLLSSQTVPESWDGFFRHYKSLLGTGKLMLRREYTIKSPEQIEGSVSRGSEMFEQFNFASGLHIPSYAIPIDDSRPVTTEGSRLEVTLSDGSTQRDTLTALESLLPIPELNQEYTPDGSRLVLSPAESHIENFSPTGLLQHSSVTEISKMRFGSPNHKRTEKEKELINELQSSKKDRKLNDAFRHNCVTKMNCEPIVPLDLAIDVIAHHTNSARSDVVNLGLLVGIDRDEGLDHLKVCKLVAILNYAHKKYSEGSGGKTGKKRKSFKDMQRTKTIVTYNSMGERIVHKDKTVDLGYLADGVYKGFMSEIRKIWDQQLPRVESTRVLAGAESIQSSLVGECFPAYLSGIPGTFQGLLKKRYTQVPTVWTSDLPHWFDVGRCVRIARTILDTRLMLQRDHLFSLQLSLDILDEDAIIPHLLSLQELTVQYFERNYGSAELNVSHSKVAHFVEACFQYSKFPVLDSMRKFLCPVETNFPPNDVYVWFYVEARDYLHSGNCVSHSSVALTTETGSVIDSLSVDSSSSMTNVFWQRVKRSDARLCGEEMLKQRGGFGPSTIDELHELINVLPGVESTDYSDDSQMLDLEFFLDSLSTFFANQIADLNKAKVVVLSPACLPRKTKSASIQIDHSKRSMSTDDIARMLTNLKKLCLSLMIADPARTGIITLTHFENTMKKDGARRLGIDNTKHFVGLLNTCKKQFTDNATNGVGYVDFIAVMIACVIQNYDAPSLAIEDFIEAANTVTRGIEENQIEALLYFLGHEQCPFPGDNPLWTLSSGNVTALASRQLKAISQDHTKTEHEEFANFDWKRGLMSVSLDGNWHPGTHASSDGPGLITINKIEPTYVGAAVGECSLGVDGANWRSETTHLKEKNETAIKGSGNYIPSTMRDITSILGEARSKKPPKGQAIITPYDLVSSLSSSELLNFRDQMQVGLLRNMSAPSVQGSICSENGFVFDAKMSVDSASRFETVDSSKVTKMVRIPEMREKSMLLSPDKHRMPTARIHETMGTNTVFTELEGTSVSVVSSAVTSQHSGEAGIKKIILRRPPEEAVHDSLSGRYSVQGRASGPVISTAPKNVEIDVEYVQEEYRLSEYRQSRVHKIVQARLNAKKKPNSDAISLCDSDMESSTMSLNEFGSLSQWHDISIHDMVVHRQTVLDEEDKAAIEMKAERDKFYSQLHGKQAELMEARREARRKERETNRLAAEQMLLKDERKAKRRLEEAQRAAEEAAELLAKEEEEKARIVAERQRRAEQAAASRAAEALMLEKRRENDELVGMRHEEVRCQVVENEAKERIRKEEEKVAAAAEVERKEKLKEAIREQERQEKLILMEANKQKLADMKMELENVKMMNKQDINVHKIYADGERLIAEMAAAAAAAAAAENALREAEERAKSAEESRKNAPDEDDTIETDTETRLQKKIKKFLRVMDRTEDGTNLHPRRYDSDSRGRNFFMPMMFGEDIRFNPFTEPNYDAGWFQEQMLEDRKLRQSVYIDDYNPTRDFSDISEKVERIKIQQALDQSKMYSVTGIGEDPALVTKVFRNGAIDWMQYMSRDKHILDETKDVGTTYTEYKSDLTIRDPLNPIVDNDAFKVKSVRPIYRPIQTVTSSKLPILYRNANIGVTQLPMGHVVHEKIGKNCYRYYQVNHPSKQSLLTVDVKCNIGQVTTLLLWSPDKLPSITACDEKADCCDLNGFCCRIVAAVPKQLLKKIPPKPPVTEAMLTADRQQEAHVYRPIIAIYSPDEMSEFTLWAIASTDAKSLPKPIERVTRLIEEFNVMTSHDADKLSDHFSIYRRDARRIIDEEAAVRAESRKEIQNKIARSVLQPIISEPMSRPQTSFVSSEKEKEISEELATMEQFIARAGRLAIGNALRQTILAVVSPTKTTEPPALFNHKPIHELVPVDDSDDEDDDKNTINTDGTPAHMAEEAFRGELESFPMLYTRPVIAKMACTPYNIPDPVVKNMARPLRKELMFNPGPISYALKNSKSAGFLKGSSQQNTFI